MKRNPTYDGPKVRILTTMEVIYEVPADEMYEYEEWLMDRMMTRAGVKFEVGGITVLKHEELEK